jgi:6-phosphogluconate dehydrogenase
VIDGGNSYYVDDPPREGLAAKDIHWTWEPAAASGASARLLHDDRRDGDRQLDPLFVSLAPGIGDIPRAPGRNETNLVAGPSIADPMAPGIRQDGATASMRRWPLTPSMGILRAANVGKDTHAIDAETTPLRGRALPVRHQRRRSRRSVAARERHYSARSHGHGAAGGPVAVEFADRVSDSGEGRWTIMAAIDEAVPAPVLTAALYARFSSRGEAGFQNQLLSAMRFQFGGHHEKAHEVPA